MFDAPCAYTLALDVGTLGGPGGLEPAAWLEVLLQPHIKGLPCLAYHREICML